MVIKFRCPACRQFLGISATRAGTLTHCPSCHESILVPSSSVALGTSEVAAAQSRGEKTAAPIAEVVDQSPAAMPEEIFANEDRSPSSATPPLTSKAKENDTTGDFVSVLEKLNSLEDRASSAVAPLQQDVPAWRPGGGGALLIALSAMVVGGLVGREFPRKVSEKAAIPATPVHIDPVLVQPELTDRFVAGKVTYSDKTDSTRMDVGARILLLPLARKGTVKLSGNGFRVGADEVDWKVLVGEAESLGGVCGLVNDAGEFRLPVPSAGKYGLLIASHYQSRDPNEPISPACARFLETYFARPEQILGNVQVEFREIAVDNVPAADRLVHFPQK